MGEVEDLTPSELGTKDYWDQCYSRFSDNYGDHGDFGDCFFGEQAVVDMAEFLEDLEDVSKDSRLLDLGCGNGVLLFDLAEDGYNNLSGLDYSQQAVDLATKVAQDKGQQINFFQADLCQYRCETPYDVVVDIGTFDAVSLNPDGPRIARESYLGAISRFLRTGGLFVITSCNWTLDELKGQFTEDKGFQFVDNINYPSFEFGGVKGTKLSTAAFKLL